MKNFRTALTEVTSPHFVEIYVIPATIINVIFYNLPFFDSVLFPLIVLSSLSARLIPFLKSITYSSEKSFKKKV